MTSRRCAPTFRCGTRPSPYATKNTVSAASAQTKEDKVKRVTGKRPSAGRRAAHGVSVLMVVAIVSLVAGSTVASATARGAPSPRAEAVGGQPDADWLEGGLRWGQKWMPGSDPIHQGTQDDRIR